MSERKPTEVSQPTQAHTPAPWSVSATENDYGHVSYLIDVGHRWQPQAEHDANARLIAAAPELLAAAKAMASEGDYCEGDCSDARRLLNAAIAKAEGR